jgi:DNA-binding MarR family transcriptional regulator
MEASGLIGRIADHDDGRVTRLRLTPFGEDTSRTQHEDAQRAEQKDKQRSSSEELATVVRWLSHVSDLEL